MFKRDPDGIRRTFPDKITYTKVVGSDKLIELAKTHVGAKEEDLKVTISPGAFVSISWTDWPPEEKKLRRESCPHCFLMWNQVWHSPEGGSNHLPGCPNKYRKHEVKER